jgi:periplasmic protein TonB
METKKNPDKDLNRKSGQFFLIGLIFSTSLTITAFEWRTEKVQTSFRPRPVDDMTLLPEIPRVNIDLDKPREATTRKPKFVSQSFTPIEAMTPRSVDEMQNLPILNLDSLAFAEFGVSATDEPEADTTFFLFVELGPKPLNGFNNFYKEISTRIKYPTKASRMNVEGKVFVEFIVNKNGIPTDFKVLKGIGTGCDEEAIRVIALSKWEPGKQRGMPVRVKMVMPVIFKLN